MSVLRSIGARRALERLLGAADLAEFIFYEIG